MTRHVDYTDVSQIRLSLIRETPHVDRPVLNRADAAAAFFTSLLVAEPSEAMAIVLLDTRRRAIGWDIPYRGTVSRVAVEPRGFLVRALLANAAGILIAHNHPSGDPEPSVEDLTFTRRLAGACEVVGIELCDHLIIGDTGRWVSLRERGAW